MRSKQSLRSNRNTNIIQSLLWRTCLKSVSLPETWRTDTVLLTNEELTGDHALNYLHAMWTNRHDRIANEMYHNYECHMMMIIEMKWISIIDNKQRPWRRSYWPNDERIFEAMSRSELNNSIRYAKMEIQNGLLTRNVPLTRYCFSIQQEDTTARSKLHKCKSEIASMLIIGAGSNILCIASGLLKEK